MRLRRNLRRNRNSLASVTSRCNYSMKPVQNVIAFARLARDCVLQLRLAIAPRDCDCELHSRECANNTASRAIVPHSRECGNRTTSRETQSCLRTFLRAARNCNCTTQSQDASVRDAIAFARHMRVSAHSLARASLAVNNTLQHTATHTLTCE